MAFLVRLAKRHGAESRRMTFELYVASVDVAGAGPIVIEWVRGSSAKASTGPIERPANGASVPVGRTLALRATMFAASSLGAYQTKPSRVLIRQQADGRTIGEVALDLSQYVAEHDDQAALLTLPLQKCKDAGALIRFQIATRVAEDEGGKSQTDAPSLTVASDADPLSSHVEQTEAADTPDEHKGGDDDAQAVALLALQVERLRKEAQESDADAQRLRGEVQRATQALATTEEDNLRMKRELLQSVHRQRDARVHDQLADVRADRERLLAECDALRAERAALPRPLADLRAFFESPAPTATCDVADLFARHDLAGHAIVGDLRAMVDGHRRVQEALYDARATITRMTAQEAQIVSTWRSLAGRTVAIDLDGNVHDVDAGAGTIGAHLAADQDIARAKASFDASLAVLRNEVAELRAALDAEKARARYAAGASKDSYLLEEQLLEAKVQLANAVDALNSLEYEHQQAVATTSRDPYWSGINIL